MKFLCLVCFDPAIIDPLPPGDWAQLGRESAAYDVELQRRGKFIAAEALLSPDTARTVQLRNGAMSAVDGPVAALREPLAGFILIEAVDMAEAMEIGAHIPLARIGSVEVRPVMTF